MNESKEPRIITGEKELWVCACMMSDSWPDCDGSHHTYGNKGPEVYELDENKTYYVCTCTRSKTLPFCDGSHEKK